MADKLNIKLTFREESIYGAIQKNELNLDVIKHQFVKGFGGFNPEKCKIQWKDQDGDWVLWKKDDDVSLNIMESMAKNNQNTLNFRIIDNLETINCENAMNVRALIDSYNGTLSKARDMTELITRLDIIHHIMIITKPGEHKLIDYTREVTNWLIESYNQIHVYIDCNCKNEIIVEHEEYKRRIHFWDANDVKPEKIDLIITLGGDGTILFASWMFQHDMPPLLPFHLGSLGFLAVFDINDHRHVLRDVIERGGVRINVRMRLECFIHRNNKNENVSTCESFQVLNDLCIDRGDAGNMLEMIMYMNGCQITSIWADGLIIATSTGSTAYSLSAGGSLVHPDQDAILITPIAPHTLTARPMIIPGFNKIHICVPFTSRIAGWVSFDGRNRTSLDHGDTIVITASTHPLLTICQKDPYKDWFDGLNKVLNWNARVPQRPISP